MNEDEVNSLTERIIGCAFTVSNSLGNGFLEKVYENSLALELLKQGLHVEQQKSLPVLYDGIVVGDYYADLLVQEEIVVELKTAKGIDEVHQAQVLNYLKASKKRYGLILNFGKPKIEIKRVVCGY